MTATFRSRSHEAFELLTCHGLEAAGVPHGYTLKARGFGRQGNGERDRRMLAEGLGLGRLAYMSQVHGSTVRLAGELGLASDCDGLVTDRSELGVVVHAADCVPLLVWASRRNAVAAIHAGWRGTLARVTESAVRKLETLGARPGELHVALGPSIRHCCFEVGGEVVEAFSEARHPMDRLIRAGARGRSHLDLIAANRQQLIGMGIPAEQIYDSGCCTSCENHRFYSYRREGPGVGRILGVIAPAPSVDTGPAG